MAKDNQIPDINRRESEYRELTALVRAEVVEVIFEIVLGRAPSKLETAHYCRFLEQGHSRQELLEDILLKPEALLKRDIFRRFEDFYRRHLPFPESIVKLSNFLPIRVVDVGGQLLDYEEHIYAPMMREGTCRVICFEPLSEEAAKRTAFEPDTQVLPYLIGDGREAVFHLNAMPATSSLYPANKEMMDKFAGLSIILPTRATRQVQTRRLDDLKPEIISCDFLKIDVQGGELDVLKGARNLIKNVPFIHLEVEFEEIYKGQAVFSEINGFLREADFQLIDLLNLGYDSYGQDLTKTASKLLWADAVYMKNEDVMSLDLLMKAAYIAHVCYGKFDLAAHLFKKYDEACRIYSQTNVHSVYIEALHPLKDERSPHFWKKNAYWLNEAG